MRNNLIIVMLILIGGLIAQPGGFGPGMGLSWNDELNLTTDQIKQIEQFRNEFLKEQIDLRAAMQKMRIDLQELLRADDPDQKAINSLLDEIQDKELTMNKLRVAHHLQVRELLTDEQKALFDQHSLRRERGFFDHDRDGKGPRRQGGKRGQGGGW